jgi:hypothetical protein
LITHTARKPKRQNLTKVAIFTPEWSKRE